MSPTDAFAAARELLLRKRDDYEAAYAEFAWPRLERFNWALDWFDVFAKGNSRPALVIVDDAGVETTRSFAELSEISNRVANHLLSLGIGRGDRVLLLLNNVAPLWEVLLAAMKIGAVVIPATTQLTRADLEDRIARGAVKLAVVSAADESKLAGLDLPCLVVGGPSYERALSASATLAPPGETRATDPLLLYFTSGTTSKPKLVLHSHQSYPVGHLSTLYWIGLKEGDRHLNISSPGWAKHAWSCVFAPWNAGATVYVHAYARFVAKATLAAMSQVDTLCAPPTVWRMFLLEDLAALKPPRLREAVSAGEPLNPEVIERVRQAWGITVRDGYGQTETTAVMGNTPGQEVVLGSMGRPLPGYEVALLDAEGRESNEGELSLRLARRPLGLMTGYLGDDERNAQVTGGGFYRTGDEASRDDRGRYHYVGRGDDVFKSSDYRLSPFELESVLAEHPAIAESAVVPSPDPLRTSVPKAVVVLKPGHQPTTALAHEILEFVKQRVAPYKRIRRLEFAELPKTISGKIRRVELRKIEAARVASGVRPPLDFGTE